MYSKQLKSEDFVNLKEAPKAKDSPTVGKYYGFQDPGEGPGVPRMLQRRSSTNYEDALNLREAAAANGGDTEIAPEDLGNKGMDLQNAKHDIQRDITQDNETSCFGICERVDMGDKVQHGSRGGNEETMRQEIFTKADYLDKDNERNFCMGTNASPPMFRRKSSFEYEDFKKDMYDRMKLFDD
ncbi:Igd1p KNAG_0C01970 [Huiozyma naganishii CBS 8797]|uniref:Uncharacterized protein n=1 Tax=Huiozyma naganishii (strain ATCC MYA-139 / BCRC 22969 / CBS 8797 / KCTC 17520 / NBRC 10181 / NCYC 3082 / Yp74L-3) TaxID=1071383 RepID=J7R3A3_HUIN7|nr:hypothetical protein KNAG_0C01970 [Kazachstania naganishii CBS 8797]CCK69310.1 hypothetical protein KNAG_0C01970 [Kazachstania naganishii CBS 8797]